MLRLRVTNPDWWFRSRVTGEIVVAQRPNWSLWGFLIAVVLRRLLPGGSGLETLAAGLVIGFGFAWAVDELVRGVNPWRRLLGVGAIGLLAASVLG